MLSIAHFSKTYSNGKKAVDDLSLTIAAGDILGFIGPNGAGKTTTLKAAVGILPYTEGEILLNGISPKTDPVKYKAQLAFIPDSPHCYEFLTGMQFLSFIGDIYRIPKNEREQRIMHYAERFEIADALTGLIGAYSRGMKQKVAIIGALIHEPALLVLDEPFVGLDPKAAYTLKRSMHEHCAKGNAAFFSTHALDTVEKLCNNIAIIKEGRLIAYGAIDKVKGDKSLENVFLELYDHA